MGSVNCEKAWIGKPGRLFVLPLTALVLLSLFSVFALEANAATKWKLTYGRQFGNAQNGGSLLAEVFATESNGAFTQIGVTNRFNPTFAVFGNTNPASDPFHPGNRRTDFQSGIVYDFMIYDPAFPSDDSPDCHWEGPLPQSGHYSFEFHFRKVDDSTVTLFPFQPVYHYDLVNGFNTATTEAPNANSDGKALTNWTTYQAQTFVVPAGINRIISAKAYAIRGFGEKFTMRCSIRQGPPTGPQVGPAVNSVEIFSGDFNNVVVNWGIDDVPVTPGQVYSLYVEATDGQGFNAFGTTNNNYPNGNMWNGTTSLPNQDMVAVVVGAFVSSGPQGTPTPTPTMSPQSNRLLNPGFEISSGFNHPNWNNNLFEANENFPDPGSAQEGGQWAGYSFGSGGNVIEEIYQVASVTPGQRYNLSAYGFVGGSNGSAVASLRWFDGNYLGGGSVQLASVSWSAGNPFSGWTPLTGVVTPTGNTLTFILRSNITGFGSGALFDNCAVLLSTDPTPTPGPATPTPTPTNTVAPGTNILRNLGFEQSNATTHPNWKNRNGFGTNGTFPNPINAKEGSKWSSRSYGSGGTISEEIFQVHDVAAGHPYRLSTFHNTGGGNGSVVVSLRWVDGGYDGGLGGTVVDSYTWTYPQAQTGWIELAGNVTPTGSILTFILRVDITGFGGGTNFDDCSLVDQSGAPASTSTPTRTPTPTNTSIPANTSTPSPTRTNTPAVSTSTPTRTSTPTNTPLSSTATPTNTPPAGSTVVKLNPADLVIHHPPANVAITNGTGTLMIDIENAADLGAFQFDVTYNGAVVFVAQSGDVDIEPFLGSTGNTIIPVGPVINNPSGRVTSGASSFGPNPGPNGNGSLARIVWSSQFVSQKTIVPLNLQNVQVTDTLGTPQGVTLVNGQVTVCYFADIDCDNDVDISDLQQVAGRWGKVVGNPQYNRLYDIDKDGDVDIVDIQLVAGKWNTAAPFAP